MLYAWRQGRTLYALSEHVTPPYTYRQVVANLDRMLAQLKKLGVEIDGKVEDDFNGRFAHIFDPEGNKIQLWEPKPGY